MSWQRVKLTERSSKEWLESCKANKDCVPSMRRKANFWDDAPMESFFSRLKVELVYAECFESIAAAKSAFFEYIEVFFNRKRRHPDLGYLSLVECGRRCA